MYSGRPPAHALKFMLTPKNAPVMLGASSSENVRAAATQAHFHLLWNLLNQLPVVLVERETAAISGAISCGTACAVRPKVWGKLAQRARHLRSSSRSGNRSLQILVRQAKR